ncbi:helix-turn-helix domain-containing protein [Paracoccus tibetensis]|uniref:helix-turn-helix domain-containing protein n=1 Tax=Paracoccus tibetensis TaxID=336292 RepID=UPI000B83E44C
MMTLGEYLRASGTRQEDFASRVGVTQATISRLVRGVASPSIDMAAAIKAATGGAVDFEAWVTSSRAANSSNQETSHAQSSSDTASDAA